MGLRRSRFRRLLRRRLLRSVVGRIRRLRIWTGLRRATRYDGSLRLKVKPREASVYVDGYFAGRVDDFDGMFQRLQDRIGAAPGRSFGSTDTRPLDVRRAHPARSHDHLHRRTEASALARSTRTQGSDSGSGEVGLSPKPIRSHPVHRNSCRDDRETREQSAPGFARSRSATITALAAYEHRGRPRISPGTKRPIGVRIAAPQDKERQRRRSRQTARSRSRCS